MAQPRRSSHHGHWIRDGKRAAIYARDAMAAPDGRLRCLWCGRAVRTGCTGLGAATLDHWLPRSLGGTNLSANLFTACLSCNSARADLPALVFAGADTGKLDRILDATSRPLAGYRERRGPADLARARGA